MKTDIQIARECEMKPIEEIAKRLGIDESDLELYGKYKAKLSAGLWDKIKNREDGKLVLVTAITPTPAGEGKTTVSVGLGQALCRAGKNAVVALREPSLGPVMGMKGGAAGGGYSQVVPMEDINLHFTGDIHAITAANNLLSAMIDNHIHQGNELGIDPRRILFKRAMDINDRAMRRVVIGLGGKANSMPREDGFQITAASEVMAVLCLSRNIQELKEKLSRILIGYKFSGEPVYCKDLKAEGAMAVLLRDAMKPNLVQTLENTPCIIHGGPFANIAHGCNSVQATKYALKLSDICVTEAGFGADLGAEKFLDIKCRYAGLKPDAAVIVATVRALKYLGGVPRAELAEENTEAVKRGLPNLTKHIENIGLFGIPAAVAVNRFSADTHAELETIKEHCSVLGVPCEVVEVFEKGGAGGLEFADKLLQLLRGESNYRPLYALDIPLSEKIETIAVKIYGADGVDFQPAAAKALLQFEEMGYGNLPVCMAKTQYSLSDNPKLLARPEGFRITVREAALSAGAGFVVALTGDIMTMPGLPKTPTAANMDVDENENIEGLF